MRSALCVLLLWAGCSRTGTVWVGPDRPDAGSDDASVPPPDDDDAGTTDACAPEQERCDGLDNDCNGQIDDGLAPLFLEGPAKFREDREDAPEEEEVPDDPADMGQAPPKHEEREEPEQERADGRDPGPEPAEPGPTAGEAHP